MARTRHIDKYPLAAYSTMFSDARQAGETGGTYRLLCETKKQAVTRRFEFYAFIRALGKSDDIIHLQMAKEFRGFKLTLMPAGDGDKTYIQFEAWDRTALALDILAQSQAFHEARGDNLPTPDTTLKPAIMETTSVLGESESGKAQMDVFRRLGYGGKEK